MTTHRRRAWLIRIPYIAAIALVVVSSIILVIGWSAFRAEENAEPIDRPGLRPTPYADRTSGVGPSQFTTESARGGSQEPILLEGILNEVHHLEESRRTRPQHEEWEPVCALADWEAAHPGTLIALLDSDLSDHSKMYVAWAMGLVANAQLDGRLWEIVTDDTTNERIKLGALRGLYPYRRNGFLFSDRVPGYADALFSFIQKSNQAVHGAQEPGVRDERSYDRGVAWFLMAKLQPHYPDATRLLVETFRGSETLAPELFAWAPDDSFWAAAFEVMNLIESGGARSEKIIDDKVMLLAGAPGLSSAHSSYAASVETTMRIGRTRRPLDQEIYREFLEVARTDPRYSKSLSPQDFEIIALAIHQDPASRNPLAIEASARLRAAADKIETESILLSSAMIEGYLSDPDPELRLEILKGASSRFLQSPSFRTQLEQIAWGGQNPEERVKALQLLFDGPTRQELVPLVFTTLESDPTAAVRISAAEYLAATSKDLTAEERSRLGQIVRRLVTEQGPIEDKVNLVYRIADRRYWSPFVTTLLSDIAGHASDDEVRLRAREALDKSSR